MQRKTIGYGEWPRGRLYTYWDRKNGWTANAGAQSLGEPVQNQSRSWLEYLAAGTGAIALLGGLTYGLGLLALWVPIWRTYTESATSAWYGVSLVHRTVVAGLGLEQLVIVPIVLIILYCVQLVAQDVALNYLHKRWGSKASLAFGELLLLASAASLGWGVRSAFNLNLRGSVAVAAAFFVIANAVAITAFLLLRRAKRNRDARTEGPDKTDTGESSRRRSITDTARNRDAAEAANGPGSNSKWARFWPMWWGRWWPVLVFALVLAYLAAALIVARQDPPLPTVKVSGEKDMKGALLAHTEGFWYVFDVKGKNKGKLIALRDDQVATVTLSGALCKCPEVD